MWKRLLMGWESKPEDMLKISATGACVKSNKTTKMEKKIDLNDTINLFKNLLKYASPVFILLGITQLTSYYNQFNFNILSYLDFTEILIAFLNNLSAYIFITLPIYLYFIGKQEDSKGIIFYFIVCLLYTIYTILNSADQNLNLFKQTLFYFLILSFLFVKIFQWLKIEVNAISLTLLSVIILFCLLVSLSISSIVDANDVKTHHIYTGTSIFIDGEEIKSNDTLYFIGKTNNYFIYYNSIQKLPVIYPTDKIDKILLRIHPVERGGERPPRPH